jgi:hypothetical protein
MDASGAALLGERTSTRFIVPWTTKKRFPAASYTMWRRCGSLAGALVACECTPLVACAEIANWPVAAPESAPNNTATGCPGDTEKRLAGLVLTPLGRLESVISTASEKPCSEVTVTETAELVSPCATRKVLVDSAETTERRPSWGDS